MNNGYYIPNPQVYSNMTPPININNELFETLFLMEEVLGKAKKMKAKLYMSFPHSDELRDKVFEGIIEQTGKDYILLSDPKTGNWNLLPINYINYVEFEENIIDTINKSKKI